MTRDLVTDANKNLRKAFVVLAEEVQSGTSRRFGSVTAASTGLPVPLFNRVFVFDPAPADDVAAAVGWTAERDVPFWVTVAEPAIDAIEGRLADLDLERANDQPGMALASLDGIPSRDSIADIAEVTGRDELEDFDTVSASAFEMPLEVAEQVDRAAWTADGVRLFLGSVDGQPAAAGVLVRSGDVAGVYNIGVDEEFRRQGIGRAMSWEVLRAGRDAGCQIGVLQSSEMGYPLYKEMGFETTVTYHNFGPAT